MSTKTSNVYGYGFGVPEDERVIMDFIIAHKEAFCQSDEERELFKVIMSLIGDGYDMISLDVVFERYVCDTNCLEGTGAAIANIMTRETGIRFEFHPGMDNENKILFPESYPWYYNEKERELTRETLDEIMSRYVDELGIDKEADYEDIEYWG